MQIKGMGGAMRPSPQKARAESPPAPEGGRSQPCPPPAAAVLRVTRPAGSGTAGRPRRAVTFPDFLALCAAPGSRVAKARRQEAAPFAVRSRALPAHSALAAPWLLPHAAARGGASRQAALPAPRSRPAGSSAPGTPRGGGSRVPLPRPRLPLSGSRGGGMLGAAARSLPAAAGRGRSPLCLLSPRD